MQWSCPHCGVSLALPNDKVGAGWSFSRCYKCGGFALVRKTEVNIIKVDKAPPGERVLLPEATEDPATTMLSKNALNNLMRNDEKQVRPRIQAPEKIAFATEKLSQAKALVSEEKVTRAGSRAALSENLAEQVTDNKAYLFENRKNTFDISKATLPEPLPEVIQTEKQERTIPFGIGLSATVAIISGIYLYAQSQTLWEKAREIMKNGHRITHVKPIPEVPDGLSKNTENPNPEVDDDNTVAAKSDSIAHLSMTLAKQDMAAPSEKTEIVDRVQKSAMAPLKLSPSAVNSLEKREVLPQQSFLVKIRDKRANLHSGPGINFPVIGTAGPEVNYIATEWNNRWFKLLLKGQTPPSNIGWIQNDSVQILSEVPGTQSARVASPNVNPLRE